MEFLSLAGADRGVYNGADLIYLVDHGHRIELHFTHDDVFDIDDAATMDYIRAYAGDKQFFVLGEVCYNPVRVHHVEVDPEAGVAYITDANGEPATITEPAKIGALLAAASAFVWQPST